MKSMKVMFGWNGEFPRKKGRKNKRTKAMCEQVDEARMVFNDRKLWKSTMNIYKLCLGAVHLLYLLILITLAY